MSYVVIFVPFVSLLRTQQYQRTQVTHYIMLGPQFTLAGCTAVVCCARDTPHVGCCCGLSMEDMVWLVETVLLNLWNGASSVLFCFVARLI